MRPDQLIDRRLLLQGAGALGLLATPVFGRARAARRLERTPTLVVLFLRGGIDGLNLVVPYGDAHYERLRPNLRVPRPGPEGAALDLDGFFGLHPAASALAPHFASGRLRALHAVGHEASSRSHFEEEDVWETGVAGNTIHTQGWLNRHLATTVERGPVRAVTVGNALPRLLRGDVPAVAVRGLDDLLMTGGGGDAAARALARAYGAEGAGTSDALSRGGRATLDALAELEAVARLDYRPKADYPDTELGRSLREVARVVRADVGLEVATVDFGGWDTHQNQGGLGGPFAQRVRQLGDALGAFAVDLEDRLDDVALLTLSEFGRTAAQNGTNGTDHGWGNVVLALGGADAGGAPVRGRWPGLGPDELHEGRDLQHTSDLRDLLAEAVGRHLANPRLDEVIPGHEAEAVGLFG